MNSVRGMLGLIEPSSLAVAVLLIDSLKIRGCNS